MLFVVEIMDTLVQMWLFHPHCKCRQQKYLALDTYLVDIVLEAEGLFPLSPPLTSPFPFGAVICFE